MNGGSWGVEDFEIHILKTEKREVRRKVKQLDRKAPAKLSNAFSGEESLKKFSLCLSPLFKQLVRRREPFRDLISPKLQAMCLLAEKML